MRIRTAPSSFVRSRESSEPSHLRSGGLSIAVVIGILSLLLVACSSGGGHGTANPGGATSSQQFAAPSDKGLQPKHGGTLTIGSAGGGSAETLNPDLAFVDADFLRAASLYDPLVSFTPSGGLQYDLATSITSDSSGTVWTINLRPNVKFADGHTLNANDVIYTWQTIVKNDFTASQMDNGIDFSRTHAVSPLEVQAVLKQPNFLFPQFLAMDGQYILPNGFTDFDHPDGTGPFRFVSWQQGSTSTFSRNPDYWQPGLPYVDTLVVTSLNDIDAGVRALLAGTIDVMTAMPYSLVASVQSSGSTYVVNQPDQLAPSFYMRMDVPPFNNPKVRQAMKLAINRQACVTSALDGYGQVGNDLIGPGTSTYDKSIPQRAYDPAKAKSLLQQAGVTLPLHVTLTTGEAGPGMNECSQVFAQSAQAAGIDISVKVIPPNDVYNTGAGYFQREFGSSQYEGQIFPTYVLLSVLPDSPINEEHYNDPQFDALWNQMLGTADSSARQKLLNQLQLSFWNNSGSIDWGIQDTLFGFRKSVHGAQVLTSPTHMLNPWHGIQDLWISG